MELQIEYCSSWNYKPRAASVADQLNEKYNTEVKLVAGSGGCFEVTFDGKLIYSKLETGQFPTIGQITSAIDGW